MNMSESVKAIAPALIAAKSEMSTVPKSGHNKFDNYEYATLEDFVAVAKPILAKHKLSVVTSVNKVESLQDRTTKNGGIERCVRVECTMRILHESGEWIEGNAWGEGQDRADKAVYKAITGARKYGLASLLCLATSDDPERDGASQTPAAPSTAPAKKQAAPALAPEDAKWMDGYIDTMEKRGCTATKARSILAGMLKTKNLTLAKVPADAGRKS
jgi:hypothetical protein